MAKKIYVALQTPVVELAVSAMDASGTVSTIFVGYKRYPITESDAQLEKYHELNSQDSDGSAVNSFITSQISYIKGASLYVQEEGSASLETVTVADTRLTLDDETLWGKAENALPYLLNLYLASAPWRIQLISNWFKAVYNTHMKAEAEVKN